MCTFTKSIRNLLTAVKTSSEQKILFARHEYGQIGVSRIKMRLLGQKL